MSNKAKNNNIVSLQKVPCPAWIQRKMISNSTAASRAIVNKKRAATAKAILDSLGRIPDIETLEAFAETVSSKPSLTAQPVVQAVHPELQPAYQHTWNRVKNGVGKIVRKVTTFLSVRRSARLALNKG
jgi:hypothetical protein